MLAIVTAWLQSLTAPCRPCSLQPQLTRRIQALLEIIAAFESRVMLLPPPNISWNSKPGWVSYIHVIA